MAWNGTGAFNRTNGVNTGTQVWQDDRDAGTKIRADRHDTHDQDLADGINATLAKNGENAATGNLNLGNNRYTNAADGTAGDDLATVSQAQSGGLNYATDTGAANAYVISPSPAITAYAAGQTFRFIAVNANTGASTLNVSGLGTKTIKKNGNTTDLASGDIAANDMVTVVYDGTVFQVTVILSGVAWGDVTGTLSNQTDLQTALDAKAPLSSPALTGTPTAPTPTTGDNDTSIATTAFVNAEITNDAITQGEHSIWIPAVAMIPRSSNGASVGETETTTNKVMIKTLDFDSSADEFAQFSIKMPHSWDEGTITFLPIWSHPSTATNFGVSWRLQARAFANDAALDQAFGATQQSQDTGGTTDDLYHGPESSAITIAGSPTQGTYVQFQIYRDVSDAGDTMAVDARLHGIRINYTIDAGNDS